jgi:hypothetical protein
MIDDAQPGLLYSVMFDDGIEQLYLSRNKGLLSTFIQNDSLTDDVALAERWIKFHLTWAKRFNIMYRFELTSMHYLWQEKHPQYFKAENYKVIAV